MSFKAPPSSSMTLPTPRMPDMYSPTDNEQEQAAQKDDVTKEREFAEILVRLRNDMQQAPPTQAPLTPALFTAPPMFTLSML